MDNKSAGTTSAVLKGLVEYVTKVEKENVSLKEKLKSDGEEITIITSSSQLGDGLKTIREAAAGLGCVPTSQTMRVLTGAIKYISTHKTSINIFIRNHPELFEETAE